MGVRGSCRAKVAMGSAGASPSQLWVRQEPHPPSYGFGRSLTLPAMVRQEPHPPSYGSAGASPSQLYSSRGVPTAARLKEANHPLSGILWLVSLRPLRGHYTLRIVRIRT